MGDSRGYDDWAQRIAAGDWIGHDVFYQAPLYPYFLGVIYAVAGRHLLLVRVIQALIGSASCALLGLAAGQLFSDARLKARAVGIVADAQPEGSRYVGLVAGLMLALYAPAIFFDGLIQKSVLDEFFVCLALWITATILNAELAESAEKPTKATLRSLRPLRSAPWTWLFLGLTMGGLALTRENALVFIAVIVAWAVLPNPNSRVPNRRPPQASRCVPGWARRCTGPRRCAQHLRRRRLLHHDVAVWSESLHRQPSRRRRHLRVASIRPRRARVRTARRDRTRRARAGPPPDARGGLELLDRPRDRFHDVAARCVAPSDGKKGAPRRQRHGDAGYRKPGVATPSGRCRFASARHSGISAS